MRSHPKDSRRPRWMSQPQCDLAVVDQICIGRRRTAQTRHRIRDRCRMMSEIDMAPQPSHSPEAFGPHRNVRPLRGLPRIGQELPTRPPVRTVDRHGQAPHICSHVVAEEGVRMSNDHRAGRSISDAFGRPEVGMVDGDELAAGEDAGAVRHPAASEDDQRDEEDHARRDVPRPPGRALHAIDAARALGHSGEPSGWRRFRARCIRLTHGLLGDLGGPILTS